MTNSKPWNGTNWQQCTFASDLSVRQVYRYIIRDEQLWYHPRRQSFGQVNGATDWRHVFLEDWADWLLRTGAITIGSIAPQCQSPSSRRPTSSIISIWYHFAIRNKSINYTLALSVCPLDDSIMEIVTKHTHYSIMRWCPTIMPVWQPSRAVIVRQWLWPLLPLNPLDLHWSIDTSMWHRCCQSGDWLWQPLIYHLWWAHVPCLTLSTEAASAHCSISSLFPCSVIVAFSLLPPLEFSDFGFSKHHLYSTTFWEIIKIDFTQNLWSFWWRETHPNELCDAAAVAHYVGDDGDDALKQAISTTVHQLFCEPEG